MVHPLPNNPFLSPPPPPKTFKIMVRNGAIAGWQIVFFPSHLLSYKKQCDSRYNEFVLTYTNNGCEEYECALENVACKQLTSALLLQMTKHPPPPPIAWQVIFKILLSNVQFLSCPYILR